MSHSRTCGPDRPTTRPRAARGRAAARVAARAALALLAGCGLAPGGGTGVMPDPIFGGQGGAPADAAVFTPQPGSLREIGSQSGRLIGAALGTYHFGDAQYTAVSAREFSVLTPENEMKWDATERSRGVFNFAAGDRLVAFAQQHGMKVRGHALVWYMALPAWVKALRGEELLAAMRAHVRGLVSHYRGKVYAWDVVNEAIADAGGGLRADPPWNELGTQYIDDAFRAAREADPEALLFYNDYNGEFAGQVKSDAIYNLVRGMQQRGVPIDGVGLQLHVDPRSLPPMSRLAENIARLAALGLDVDMTEIDVPVGQIPGDLAAKFQRQAEIYHQLTAACVAAPRCKAITFWGVADKHSWLNDPQWERYRGAGPHYPLLFDGEYRPKPAVDAVKQALRGM